MRCADCGTENPESARFCGSCGARVSTSCPRCDAPAPLGLRFCTACGFALQADAPSSPADLAQPEAGGVAERRRVSVLFLDLDDFTSIAETLDPEEVRALQSRYFETVRAVITRYGGTIEKFIGDAVMAVWGAPTAHEDDAARAVRCAIALVDAVGRLGGAAARGNLTARAGVTSGEAAVTMGAVGQGMVAGDLVNVAARLQGMAPAASILVDDATHALATDAATYKPGGPIEIRGRSSAVTAWDVLLAPGSGDRRPVGIQHAGPFVGRDRELRELVELFDGVVRDGRGRLLSVTGIAGIGKSRLIWELQSVLDARPDLVAWHAGRAPAYGEEITFSAVAEMVRRRVRTPEGTPPDLARRQLAAALSELVREDEERRWLEPRLAALLGSERLDAFDRDELFGAWRRFFERVAETSPVVLVFEDLQWADPALVDFVEHLGAWARHHPLLVVGLARPELLDRRPGWGSAAASFTSLHLERLPDEAMRRLLELRSPGLAESLVSRILEHAGGVPLYAVEVMRIIADVPRAEPGVADRRIRTPRDDRDAGAVDVPDSLHGVISARIDALPAHDRRLLLAASVLGRRFRLEALVAIGADPNTVRERTSRLVDRELLSVDADAADPATAELSFVQDMVREVAYRTLSRRERRTLHLAAAQWLESSEEAEAAESLAGHLARVHDLAPEHPDAPRIARRAVSALRRSAASSLERHVPQRAFGLLEQALRLTDSPEQRAVVLDEAASAASAAGRLDVAERHLRELIEIRAAADNRRDIARARARLASVMLTAQRNEPAVAELESALRAVRDIGRDPGGVELAAQLARARLLIGDERVALDWTKRAMAAAERHDLPAVAADLLVTRGTARFRIGDEDGGIADLRAAVADAERIGSLSTELRARNNLAWLMIADDPHATLDAARQAVDLATTKGGGDLAAQLADVACSAAIETGDWTWALARVDELLHEGTPLANRIGLAGSAAVIRGLRGHADPLAPLTGLEPLPEDLDDQVKAGIAHSAAWVAFASGRHADARVKAQVAVEGSLGVERCHALALYARSCLWDGAADAAQEAVEEIRVLAVRGRAVDAHLMTLEAGIVARSDPVAAHELYRTASDAWRALQLPGMLAVCLADECRTLEAEPSAEALDLFDLLEADGLRRLVGAQPGPMRPPVNLRASRARRAPAPRPSAGTARPTGAGRRSRPVRGRRSPGG
jgi:class 3 adenylate cyclase/tetratricopeptide (TPR) repeat protein